MGQVAAQGLAALVQVLHFRGVVRRFVKRNFGQLAVRHRDVETVTEGFDVLVRQLLGLVHVVLALARFAHAKTFDGLDQQHGRLACVIHSFVESGIDLFGVMSAAAQIKNFFVRHLGHHFQGAWIATKEMFAHIGAVVGFHGLVVAVQRVHHDFLERTLFVAGQQGVPTGAPQQLDDVPARATELAFKLLHDLAVASHRAVQALQIAVDHEDQVVQVLAGGQTDGAQGFDLVHLAIAAEHPDLAVFGVGNATGMQVLQKARLVNRHQGAQAHGHRGELPKLGHQLGVWVTGQTLAVDLLAEVEQLLFGQAAFKVGAGINARRYVALDVEAITTVFFSGLGALSVPEMVETSTKQTCQRGKRANVATQITAVFGVMSVGLDDHGHGVPAHVGAQALFDFQVAG